MKKKTKSKKSKRRPVKKPSAPTPTPNATPSLFSMHSGGMAMSNCVPFGLGLFNYDWAPKKTVKVDVTVNGRVTSVEVPL